MGKKLKSSEIAAAAAKAFVKLKDYEEGPAKSIMFHFKASEIVKANEKLTLLFGIPTFIRPLYDGSIHLIKFSSEQPPEVSAKSLTFK